VGAVKCLTGKTLQGVQLARGRRMESGQPRDLLGNDVLPVVDAAAALATQVGCACDTPGLLAAA
jgi:hypothetical protein